MKKIKKILVYFWIGLVLLPHNGLILAQEVTPTETITPDLTEENEIITGDSSSETEINNEINIIDSEPTPTATVISTENTTDLTNQSETDAISGDNSSGDDEAAMEIITGSANSYTDIVNLINVNLINSNLKILIVNNFDGQIENIDLNKIWQEAQGEGIFKQVGSQMLLISSHNYAALSNKVKVLADSGNNSISSSGDALIISGEANAIANVVNLVNVNFAESKLFIGIVNVDGDSLGDLILPSPETTLISQEVEVKENKSDKETELNNEINTSANSGLNQEINTGISYIRSGDSIAGSNSFNDTGNTYVNQDQTLVIVNILGNSSGNILNRLYPGSVESMEGLNQIVYYRNDGVSSPEKVELYYQADNYAQVENQIEVSANSGSNTIWGADVAEIQTGRAIAWANINNIINSDFFGGSKFYSLINIFGDWKGNLVLAYPDVGVKISGDRSEFKEGEAIAFNIVVSNFGYEMAKGIKLEVEIPQGMDLISSENISFQNGRLLSWNWDKLDAGEEKIVKFEAKAYRREQAITENLVRPVMAAEEWESQNIRLIAKIESSSIESDDDNNIALADSTLLYPTGKRIINSKIELSGNNNVNEYINQNDVVTFEFFLKNSGEGEIEEGRLIHEIYSQEGMLWSRDEIKIGDIKNQQNGQVGFGIPMTEARGGNYYSRSIMVGRNENGDEVTSNEVNTEFLVKATRYFQQSLNQTVNAQESSILGLNTQMSKIDINKRNIILYLILFISSSSYLGIEIIKKLRHET